jgi:hypothetical protein
MIDAIRVNIVRESRALEEYEDEEFWATTLWLKASVSFIFCPNNFINHYSMCLALILMGSY